MKTTSSHIPLPGSTLRRNAMAVLSQALLDELEGPVAALWPALEVRDLKPVETGLVMLRGRMGGDGAAFNLGEATVTRAVVEIDGGERGYAILLGRDKHRARLAAIVDALWQQEGARPAIEREIITPVAKRLQAQRNQTAAETAATRVDFFTLVRGED